MPHQPAPPDEKGPPGWGGPFFRDLQLSRGGRRRGDVGRVDRALGVVADEDHALLDGCAAPVAVVEEIARARSAIDENVLGTGMPRKAR